MLHEQHLCIRAFSCEKPPRRTQKRLIFDVVLFLQGALAGDADEAEPDGTAAGVRDGHGRGRGQLRVHGDRNGRPRLQRQHQADRDQ